MGDPLKARLSMRVPGGGLWFRTLLGEAGPAEGFGRILRHEGQVFLGTTPGADDVRQYPGYVLPAFPLIDERAPIAVRAEVELLA
jgi:hypothetical protein